MSTLPARSPEVQVVALPCPLGTGEEEIVGLRDQSGFVGLPDSPLLRLARGDDGGDAVATPRRPAGVEDLVGARVLLRAGGAGAAAEQFVGCVFVS